MHRRSYLVPLLLLLVFLALAITGKLIVDQMAAWPVRLVKMLLLIIIDVDHHQSCLGPVGGMPMGGATGTLTTMMMTSFTR